MKPAANSVFFISTIFQRRGQRSSGLIPCHQHDIMPTAGKGISKRSPDLRRRSSDQNGAILLNTASAPIDDAHHNYNDDIYNQKVKPPGGHI
jgi:hypothetical protein